MSKWECFAFVSGKYENFVISYDEQSTFSIVNTLGHEVLRASAEGKSIAVDEGTPSYLIWLLCKAGLRFGFKTIRVGYEEFPISSAIYRFEAKMYDDETSKVLETIKTLFYPETVAVIGASRERDTIAGRLFFNIINYGFHGGVFPVNPKAKFVQGIKAYPSVLDIPVDIDLAFITVPARIVPTVAKQCGEKGVKALAVITAGFAEVGGEGIKLQEELVEICHQYGMRLIGPNCMGIDNTDEDVRFHATFLAREPVAGNVSFLSQSGSLGAAVMEKASFFNLGLRHFISVGNRADVGTPDILSLWKEDNPSEAILLYLETVDQPRRLRFTANSTARLKPIIALKGGQSSAGLRATSSHTGSLLKSSPALQEAYFKQSGIVSVHDLSIFMGLPTLLTKQPLPEGNRVAIITNGGGPGILVTDACEKNGLEVPPLSDEIQEQLREFLPAEASVGNPVDMIASATPEQYKLTVETVARDPNIDAIIVIFIPPLSIKAEDVALKLKEAMENMHSSGHCKTLVAMFLSEEEPPSILFEEPFPIPTFTFPDEVARALSKALEYKKLRDNSYHKFQIVEDINFKEIGKILEGKKGWLPASDVYSILKAMRLPVARTEFASDLDRLLSLAGDMPAPYVLKAEAPGLIHKSDVGAIRLDIHNVSELKQAGTSMLNSLKEKGFDNISFILQSQQQTCDSYELMVGVSHTELGHSIVVGQGGTAVEVIKDIATCIVPINESFAQEMIESLQIYRLLKGYRNQKAYDTSPLINIMLRLSSLVEVFPEIKDIDLNPVFLYPDRAVIVDFRMFVDSQE